LVSLGLRPNLVPSATARRSEIRDPNAPSVMKFHQPHVIAAGPIAEMISGTPKGSAADQCAAGAVLVGQYAESSQRQSLRVPPGLGSDVVDVLAEQQL
jgi:hypothetical protein